MEATTAKKAKDTAVRTRNYRYFYQLLGQLVGAQEGDFIGQYTDGRTQHKHDMREDEWAHMVGDMERLVYERQHGARDAKMDKARKRVMAAIGGMLQLQGYAGGAATIKSIALRATEGKYAQFNSIPLERLNSLYAAFAQRQRDIAAARSAAVDEEVKKRLEGVVVEVITKSE
jgi:hypothetical protein